MANLKGVFLARIISAHDLRAADSNGKSDPYVIVGLENNIAKSKFKTQIVKKNLNPFWDEQFKIPATTQDIIKFIVKDWDRFGSDDPLGEAQVHIETLLNPPNTAQNLTLDLALTGIKKGHLKVELTFIEEALVEELTNLSKTKFFRNMNNQRPRDYILIVDKSGSMQVDNRWSEARAAVASLAPPICRADPDGITLYLFSNDFKVYKGVKDASKVTGIFEKTKPDCSTDLAKVLSAAFDEHFKQKNKQTTILVITDGEPDDREAVKQILRNAAQTLTHDEDLSVTFIQIGNDSSATHFLKDLDDSLDAKFDIVDTVTIGEMEGMSFEELVAKSIAD
eukprot:CAMPEP_0168558438 /NCGR_PEP_ID=MMETSP0413-20121227/9974_1 /TAXON_ID=136452 /ORGANISM="Filamoeba nolandi, Strain NC-AS-23-1" /LENGTH=336 /DNA_ID=CAMNT_0008589567 /DNA_START=104 /DNA_END=1114 /DNA_ORIENTATION=+